MIKNLNLKNFTVFKELDIEFSPKINIIIGENGTGKTHLLKAAYLLCGGSTNPTDEQEIALTTQILRLFMPLDDKLGKLHHQGAKETAQLNAHFKNDAFVILNFHNNSKYVVSQEEKNYRQNTQVPVFIPTKEVLSFMKGFNSLYEKYGLSFDLTYQDICLLLDLPEVRPENLHEKSKWAMEKIETVCGGKFVFSGGGKVTFQTDNAEYSANAMAEGFRKAGMLSRLLQTGAIKPGVSGPLFWDEPESNLNPKLMKRLVEILLELSRNGQQIILATHDYVLLKWFDLLMDKGKEDHVRFHTLYRDLDSKEIKLASTDEYLNIDPNPIDDAFGYLINQEIENDMEGLGK
ncbi:ATP/GTP-binding protein [Vampirovibrio sp.]|uniref:AAA family ATPase n=1 Tax=Vampirovibrio sp. TaxID=2717857 RepID=UPI0035933057